VIDGADGVETGGDELRVLGSVFGGGSRVCSRGSGPNSMLRRGFVSERMLYIVWRGKQQQQHVERRNVEQE
jgi:hypothetical protein